VQTTKLEDLHLKTEQSRHSTNEFSQAIDMMRISRDSKICDIEKLQAEVEVKVESGFIIEVKKQLQYDITVAYGFVLTAS
jgi:hypothetical protein